MMPDRQGADHPAVLLQFTWIWNDLLFGLVLTKSIDVRPIMVALEGMKGVYGATDGPSVIAATLIGSAPTLILFLALQRYFVRGLTMGLRQMTGDQNSTARSRWSPVARWGSATRSPCCWRSAAKVAIVDRDREMGRGGGVGPTRAIIALATRPT